MKIPLPLFVDPLTGKESFSMTVAAIAFTVLIARWCIGGEVVAGHTFQVVSNDSITTWLTPTLGAYIFRQATKAFEGVAMAKVDAGVPSPGGTP